MINLFQPSLGEEELEAVRNVFESNWVGKGSKTDQFEAGFANHLGTSRDLLRSVSNCTEGLFQSVTLLGIGAGDEVILPSIGFVGMANAIASSDATPVFCDVDSQTHNATAQFISEKITPNTKAVMILHYGGVPCQMTEIMELLKSKNIRLIEDSACSVSSRYRGQACGTFGDVGVWSFDAMKTLVSGDGGMVYVRDKEKMPQLEQSLYLGLLSKSGFSNSAHERWWEFEISGFGRRAIMNDIASAIGLEQLKKLPDFIARRRQIHQFYDRSLSNLEWLEVPAEIPDYMESSYYLYPIKMSSKIRDSLASYLRENGVYTSFRYYPLHLVKHYNANITLPNAESIAKNGLCLPDHQSLSNEEIETVVSHIIDFGKRL